MSRLLEPLQRLTASALATLAALSAGCALATPPAIEHLGPDPVYDPVMEPQARGFLGADGVASVALSEDRVLFVFGDTIIGQNRGGKRSGPMIRNSIGIVSLNEDGPPSVSYHWDLTDGIPESFFHPADWSAPHWYWPGCGFMHDGDAWLLLTRLVEAEGEAGFSFQSVGTELVRIENPEDEPDDWRMTWSDLGVGANGLGINAAAMVEGEHVFLLGHWDGPGSHAPDRGAILARLPLEALGTETPGDQLTYLAADGIWSSSSGNPKVLYKPGATESSLHFDESIGRYVAVSLPGFQETLRVATAESLEGPWDVQDVFDIPELPRNDLYVAYTGRAHPMLPSPEGTLVVSYVVNTTDFWSMFSDFSIYYPRFVRVRLAGGEATAP